MELKFKHKSRRFILIISSNRTFMELKYIMGFHSIKNKAF